MRIYYCGHIEGDAVAKLAAVGAGKKIKKCGDTAYNRCRCGGVHPDSGRPIAKDRTMEDHPEFLCEEHLDIYED